jgi:hypothetical protein
MAQLLYAILTWVLIVTIHELGHYLTFRYYNIKPIISYKWHGIYMRTDKLAVLKPNQIIFISLSGITAGYIVMALMIQPLDMISLFIYIIMSGFDITTIISCEQMDKDSTYLDNLKLKVKQLEEEHKRITTEV